MNNNELPNMSQKSCESLNMRVENDQYTDAFVNAKDKIALNNSSLVGKGRHQRATLQNEMTPFVGQTGSMREREVVSPLNQDFNTI